VGRIPATKIGPRGRTAMAADGAQRRSKETALEATVFDGEATGVEREARRTYQGDFRQRGASGGGVVLGWATVDGGAATSARRRWQRELWRWR